MNNEIQQTWLKYLDYADAAHERGEMELVNHYRSVATGLFLALGIAKRAER